MAKLSVWALEISGAGTREMDGSERGTRYHSAEKPNENSKLASVDAACV